MTERRPLVPILAGSMLEQMDRIVRSAEAVRGGGTDEDLHRLRVAARRLRAALDVLREDGDEPRATLRAIGQEAGKARDLDVQIAALKRDWEASPEDRAGIEAIIRLREAAREEARRSIGAAIGEARLAGVAADLRETLSAGSEAGQWRRDDLADAAIDRVRSALRRLHRRAEYAPSLTDAQLHRLRIAAKRYRYTCELLKPALGDDIDDWVDLATKLQDALGSIQDDHVAIDALLADLQTKSADPAALARLIARRKDRIDESLQTLQGLWTKLPRGRKLRRRLGSSSAAKRRSGV